MYIKQSFQNKPKKPHINVVLISHQGNFSSRQMEASAENHNRSQCRVPELSPIYIYKTVPHLRNAAETEVEAYTSQRVGEFAVRLSHTNVRSYTNQISPVWLPKQELNRDKNNRLAKVDKKKTPRSQTYRKNSGNWGMLRAREIISPREEHTKSLSNPKGPALKACIQ